MACRVYFCRNRSEMPEALFQVLLHQLPGPLHPEINRFQRWQDRQASLMGKLLLHHALQLYFGDADLSRLELSQRKRPFLPEAPISTSPIPVSGWYLPLQKKATSASI